MADTPYVLFINPWWHGHIPVYMGLYWPCFLKRGWRIHNLVDNPVEAVQFCRDHFGDDSARIRHSGFPEVVGVTENLSPIDLAELRWSSLGKAVERIRQDHGEPGLVFHAWADLWTHPFLSSRAVRQALPLDWVGLCLHPVELRVRKTWKRRLWELPSNLRRHRLPTENRLRALKVPHYKHVILLDENVLPKARRFFPGALKISSFPDASNNTLDEHFRLDRLQKLKAEGRPIVAVIGVLQRRKGFLRLMEAARAAPGNWGFLIAGRIDWQDLSESEQEELRRFISDPPPNTALCLEFLEDEQFNSLVSQSDLLYLAYEDFFHSSNIQVKAAHFTKLCLTGPQHLISERTKEYNLGWTLKDHATATLIEFLAHTDWQALEEKSKSARFASFADLHSTQRLNTVLTELIKSVEHPKP
jgi:glycosyltransferase involved in cell wall biosynthesis